MFDYLFTSMSDKLCLQLCFFCRFIVSRSSTPNIAMAIFVECVKLLKNIEISIHFDLLRGTLGGTQYCNNARKIGKSPLSVNTN